MKTLPNYLRLLAIAVTVVTLGSCSDDDDYYWSPLIGDWVLVADEYGPVDTDQNIFSFYSDGSGQYVDYDNWGQSYTYDIYWDTDGSGQYVDYDNWGQSYTYDIYWDTDGSLLYVTFADGQEWVYRWAVNGNNMYLTDLDTGSQLVFAMY